jgi:hypothetical protein
MAAKAAKPAVDAALAVAADLAARRADLEQAFDVALLADAESGEDLSESTIRLGQALGFSYPDEINRQLGRARSVVRWKARAGTCADLKRDRDALVAARATRAKRLPELDAAAEKIDAERRAIDAAVTDGEQRVSTREEAREVLRKNVPPWVKDRCARAEMRVQTGFRGLPAMEARIALIPQVKTITGGAQPDSPRLLHLQAAAADTDHPEAAALARAVFEERIVEIPSGNPHHPQKTTRTTISEGAWERYLAHLETERAELEPKVAKLKAERERELETARTALDVYLED